MAGYSQYTLDALAIQIGSLLDDNAERYWTRQEKYYAIFESMRVWGGLTNYWRTRGTFNLTLPTGGFGTGGFGQGGFGGGSGPNPYYDLSAVLPNLRSRSWTLGQLVAEIQYHLLEAANGISGSGMSGQISIASILSAVQRARNKFVLDVRFPLTVNPTAVVPPPPDGMVGFPQTSVYVHRAAWQDALTGTWTNIWRDDAWATDRGNPLWTLEPGAPVAFSEAENSPLLLQLAPPPSSNGTLEIISVDSLQIDTANPASTFNVPDEWVHAIKYAALAALFSADNQLNDPLRAQYCGMRYQQAVDGTSKARSVIRILVNNRPLSIDSLAALDAGYPYWRNQVGDPQAAGILYDLLAFYPGVPATAAGILADVVAAAPLPANGTKFLQVGDEDIPNLISYCLCYLTMKCGGNEFKATWPAYDEFLSAVEGRGLITGDKIHYTSALLGTPEKEEEDRPDRLAAAGSKH